jgi:hypothetical protein
MLDGMKLDDRPTSRARTARIPEISCHLPRSGPHGLVCSGALVLALACLTAGCGDNLEQPVAPPDARSEPTPPDAQPGPEVPPGVADPAWLRARQLEYLRFATQAFNPSSAINVIAHLERDQVDDEYDASSLAVPATALDAQLEKMAALRDSRDFDGLSLMHLLFGYREHPALADGLAEKIERALLDFKYWYTEPTPEGVEDDSYYWSENHMVTYHALEYLMGQAYPDEVFGSDGKTGSEHRAHAEAQLLRWLDLRARFGFSEWHSNVYYQKSITPLLTLAEYAEDPAMRARAAGIVDILLFDMALHTQRAAFGVTHGRSYKKNKMTSWDEDTWHLTKQLFDTTTDPYGSNPDAGGVLFARMRGYELPEAVLRVARSQQVFVDRERMGLDVRFAGPYEAEPQAPHGLDYTDPDDLATWWSTGALVAWPVLPLTFQTMDAHDLWDAPLFALMLGFRPLAANPVMAQQTAAAYGIMINLPLLGEVDTYTWRSPDVMLSSAVDYARTGGGAYQAHAWQATFDANAIVFTNHPFLPVATSTDWLDDPETGGYWNGEASMPRSFQHENVAIHMYAPQYPASSPPPFNVFRYEPYTHAYLPKEHFDEVVQEDGWTFARHDSGYIALYSHRPAEYRVYDPAVNATGPLTDDFDLVAAGGADNVWLVEVGRSTDWESFDAFRTAVRDAMLEVTARASLPGGLPGGFDVSYASPSQGMIRFGWDGPAEVDGQEVAVGNHPRFDNPWSQTEFGSPRTKIEIDGIGVDLDFEAGTRKLYGPE